MKEKELKIVFVGGHHTPALAVLDALAGKFRHRQITYRFFWLGHRRSMWGDKKDSAEYLEVVGRGLPFYNLKAGKLYRTFNPRKLLRLPWGLFQAFYYLLLIRPVLVVSFGGYLALPVALAASFFRVPFVTHEQTAAAGWSNRLLGFFAKKVFISWPSSAKYFPAAKTLLTGNPVRRDIFQAASPLAFPGARESLPTIYITGGKQGAHAVNMVVQKALPILLEKYNLIHQCGHSTVTNDYLNLMRSREQLPAALKSGYLLKDYFGAEEIGAVFAKASFVISRSGANTVTELMALGKPAILIPLPNTPGQEQEKNAQMLESAGLAFIISQTALTPETLIGACARLVNDPSRYQDAARKARELFHPAAADIIAGEIIKLLES